MAKSSNWSILVDVDLQVEQAKKQLQQEFKNTKITLDTKDASSGVKDLTQNIKDNDSAIADLLLTYQVANEIFRDSIQVIGAMVDEVFELDTALTEFKKVSDLSGTALDNYVSKLSEMGNEVARTGSEMVESATEFRKNGFNDEDAAQLGQIAAMYQNVSDEAISAGDSASFIIAQLTAFGDSMTGFTTQAEKATHVIDSINEVANNFSVSSADLANNLGNMSAVMAQTGASFEESLGMLTAITEVTRNASKASRGNKSLSV